MNPDDLSKFIGLKDALLGVPIVFIVWALTEWIKNTFSLTGKTVEFVSLGVGLVVGLGYKLTTGMEATFVWWFLAVLYGLLLGIVPSMLYKTGQDVMLGAIQKSVKVEASDLPKSISGTPPEILAKYIEDMNRPTTPEP